MGRTVCACSADDGKDGTSRTDIANRSIRGSDTVQEGQASECLELLSSFATLGSETRDGSATRTCVTRGEAATAAAPGGEAPSICSRLATRHYTSHHVARSSIRSPEADHPFHAGVTAFGTPRGDSQFAHHARMGQSGRPERPSGSALEGNTALGSAEDCLESYESLQGLEGACLTFQRPFGSTMG